MSRRVVVLLVLAALWFTAVLILWQVNHCSPHARC